jgi:hypothetical protein
MQLRGSGSASAVQDHLVHHARRPLAAFLVHLPDPVFSPIIFYILYFYFFCFCFMFYFSFYFLHLCAR